MNNNNNKRQTNSKYANLVRQIEVKNEKGQVVSTREVVFYPELLNAAHELEKEFRGIETDPVQFPNAENHNTAIFTAKVKIGERIFTGTGDANPENVSPEIAKHFIRAAETRAKARALRDALNVPIVAIEELGHELVNGTAFFVPIKAQNGKKEPEKKSNGRKTKPKEPPKGETDSSAVMVTPGKPPTSPPANNNNKSFIEPQKHLQENMELMTDRQRKYIFHLLADKGMFGDDAHEHLKKVFRVDSLKEVTKQKAREYIDQLVKEVRELEEVPF